MNDAAFWAGHSRQQSLNGAAGIGLRAQTAPLDNDRVDGILNRFCEEEQYDTGEGSSRQNVHTKQWKTYQELDTIEARKRVGFAQTVADTLGNKPVTVKSIERVKAFKCETLDAAGQQRLMNAHKRLSVEARKQPVGIEVGRCFTLDMNPASGYVIGKKANHLKLPGYNIPYIATHTHPSGLTFSPDDIIAFARRSNMKMLTAVGNDGHVYALERTEKPNDINLLIKAEQLKRNAKAEKTRDGINKLFKEVKGCGIHYYS